jgi:hypothetical protein
MSGNVNKSIDEAIREYTSKHGILEETPKNKRRPQSAAF